MDVVEEGDWGEGGGGNPGPLTDDQLTGDWKVLWRWVRKGWRQPRASTLRSIMVHSTSSSSSTTSFFSALMAKNLPPAFSSASST